MGLNEQTFTNEEVCVCLCASSLRKIHGLLLLRVFTAARVTHQGIEELSMKKYGNSHNKSPVFCFTCPNTNFMCTDVTQVL